jgi:hypothetical protein
VPSQFIDHAETEDRLFTRVMQHVESDQTGVQSPGPQWRWLADVPKSVVTLFKLCQTLKV